MADRGRRGGGRGGGRSTDSNWRDRSGASGGGGGGGFGGGAGGGNVMKFSVPSKDAGRIIGKGGSKKRELEESSGATIKVFSKGDDGTTPVEISGSRACQEKAKSLIDEILDSFDRNMSFQSGGGGGGGGGSRGACYKCGEEGHIARDCPEGGGGGRGGGGRACYRCHEEGHIARDCPTSDSGSGRGGWGGGGGGDDRYNGEDSGWRGGGGGGGGDVLAFTIDSRDVGRIIGKGGSKIRELEEDSGASIKVQSRQGDGVNVPVEISGDPEARERAKQMIDDLLDSISQRQQGYKGRSNYDDY